MLEIPIEVEIAAEQAPGCGIGEVEQRRPGHEQRQKKGRAASGYKTRARQSRHRDQKEDACQLGGGAPLYRDPMRHGAARRQKKSGEQQYPKESRPYCPDPGSGQYWLRWGWRHREPRAMSLSTRGNPGARQIIGMRRFEGTDTYVATQDLRVAVNA